MNGCVCINNAYGDPQDAVISIFDHGVLYGDGVFETIRTYSTIPFRLESHLDRLSASALVLGIQRIPPFSLLIEQVSETLRRADLKNALCRITITRGQGEGLVLPPDCTPTVIVAALPFQEPPAEKYQKGITGRTVRVDMPTLPPPTVKSTSFQRAVLARTHFAPNKDQEVLYINRDNNVTEAVTANVFAVVDGILHTPPADSCLPGITRAETLDIAAELDIPISTEPLPLRLLKTSNEAFLTSSLSEIVPLVKLDGCNINNGTPGRITHLLHSHYQQRVHALVKANNQK